MNKIFNRWSRFKGVCPVEYCAKIDRSKLLNLAAFDLVAGWDGSHPGPVCTGATGTGKTRACWAAIGRLCVREGKSFRWYSGKRISDSFFGYHMAGRPESFWESLDGLDMIFLDDLDKVELSDRNASVLFEIVDWISREQKPALATTNQTPVWWADRMGAAFARRLFETAFREAKF